MRTHALAVLTGAALLAWTPLALAAEEEADDPAPESKPEKKEEPKAEAAKPEAKAEAAAEPAADASFKIRRGFFAETDLGVFFTFGGYNTNDDNLPKRFISNVQPYLGIFLGYDIVTTARVNFALGLKLGVGYTSGAGRVTADELAAGDTFTTTKPADYSVVHTELGAVIGIMMTDRLSFSIKVDGGMGFLDPDPSKNADDPDGGSLAFAPLFGGGVGIEYFTLLNDFSVGLDLHFGMILNSGAIPAAAITIPIRYTF